MMMIIGIIGNFKSGKTRSIDYLKEKFQKVFLENEEKKKEKEVKDNKEENKKEEKDIKINVFDLNDQPDFSLIDLLNLNNKYDIEDNSLLTHETQKIYETPLLEKLSKGIFIIDNFGLVKDIDFHQYINYPGFMIANINAKTKKRIENYSGLDNTVDNTIQINYKDFYEEQEKYENVFKPDYYFNKLGFPFYQIANNRSEKVFQKNIDRFVDYLIKDNNQVRKNWDEYFIQLTWDVSERSNCIMNKGGSIIVSPDHRVISTGYTGTPHGKKNCSEQGCYYCLSRYKGKEKVDEKQNCVCIHSEENAIIEIGKPKISKYLSDQSKKITLYSTRKPCLHCMKLICQVGITRVCYYSDIEEKESSEFVNNIFNLELIKIRLRTVFDEE